MIDLVNLTPHKVVLFTPEGNQVEIPPEGTTPRVRMEVREAGEVLGIPVVETYAAGVEGLPEPRPGVLYIVSRAVAQAAPDRDDLTVPDDLVRDEEGRVIGARRLARIWPGQNCEEAVEGLIKRFGLGEVVRALGLTVQCPWCEAVIDVEEVV